jgi:hypothetical protein
MTVNGQVAPDVYEGTVTATNATGVNVDGQWFTVSKFRPMELPPVGARVNLEVDPKGFIRSLQTVPTPAVATDATGRRATGSNSRLAVLKAAAAFGASRPDLKSSDVLRIADAWLAWVERERDDA